MPSLGDRKDHDVTVSYNSQFSKTVVTMVTPTVNISSINIFLNRSRNTCVGSFKALTQKLWEKIDFEKVFF